MSESEMDTKTALDLVESFNTRQVKPFQRLAEVLRVAHVAEQRAKEADQRTSAASRDLQGLRDAIEAAQKELADAKRGTRDGITALETQLRRAQTETTAHLGKLQKELDQAQRDTTAALKGLDDERAATERELAEATAAWQTKLADAKAKHEAFMKSIGAA